MVAEERARENGDGRVGRLKGAASGGRVVAGGRTRAHAREGEQQCDDMTIVDGFGSTCDVVARYNATLGDTRS